ncbi:hypothetical protein H9P43_006789 [Blastocladiella emersonii ATCC 22665]|nr:hypothetical protein H9P43_006789 [Blastocladiella emersonii ATCC 22665]
MGYTAQKAAATKKRPPRAPRTAAPAANHTRVLRESVGPLTAAVQQLDAIGATTANQPPCTMTYQQIAAALPPMETTLASMHVVMETLAATRPRRETAAQAAVYRAKMAQLTEHEAILRDQIEDIKAGMERLRREQPGIENQP